MLGRTVGTTDRDPDTQSRRSDRHGWKAGRLAVEASDAVQTGSCQGPAGQAAAQGTHRWARGSAAGWGLGWAALRHAMEAARGQPLPVSCIQQPPLLEEQHPPVGACVGATVGVAAQQWIGRAPELSEEDGVSGRHPASAAPSQLCSSTSLRTCGNLGRRCGWSSCAADIAMTGR